VQMPDVNILLYARREGAPDHARYAEWLTNLVASGEQFALSEPVLHGFIRIITHPRITDPPTAMGKAFEFLDSLIAHPNCRVLRPGLRHWTILKQLCAKPGVRGSLVADAAHAALAIENGCEWVTADSDYARFAPPLRWRLL
jgi:uncharacterized protein